MANSTRLIGQQIALLAGPSPATGAQNNSGQMVQLTRLQSVDMDWQVTRQDISVLGSLAPISQEILEAPTVSMNASYGVSNLRNESGIGLYVLTSAANSSGALTNIINGSQDSKNYYIKIAPQGQDANTYAGTDCAVVSVANANLASWSTTASVGGVPTTTIGVQGLNVEYDTLSSGFDHPGIDPSNGVNVTGVVVLPPGTTGTAGQTTLLRPGDLRVSMIQGGAAYQGLGISSFCLQSYTVSFDLSLEPQQCLGSRFPTNRYAQFPVTVSVGMEAQMKDIGSGSLAALLCNDRPVDITITLADPACGTGIGADKVRYTILGAKQTSQPLNLALQGNSTVSLNFESTIGGPNETARNILFSGSIN